MGIRGWGDRGRDADRRAGVRRAGRAGVRIGRELAGTLAGVAAAVLVVTRDSLLFWGSLDYLDIPYCALVLGAILAELRGGSRREGVVLALLAVAGLLRPEAWLLSGAYLVWVWWRDGRRLPAAGLIALTAAAPVLWVASDLVTTGRPLYSFTLTRELTGTFERVSGPGRSRSSCRGRSAGSCGRASCSARSSAWCSRCGPIAMARCGCSG